MRVLGWILAIAVVVGFVGRAIYLANEATPPPATSAAYHAAPSAVQPNAQLRESWHRHRHQFRSVSDYSQRMRTNRLVEGLGFLLFVLMTLPKNVRGARAFYRQLMARSPLPEETSPTDDINRRARRLLFFYLLFLLYQLVQFPLTWGRDNDVQFYSDLAIQSFLLVAVAASYAVLKRGMNDQWQNDPSRVRQTLHGRLEGIDIRWGDIRSMAVGVFIAGFAPALLAKLTPWLDAVLA